MKFAETPLQKQLRVDAEWEDHRKSQRTGLEFEASFEEAVTELELAGMGKSVLDFELDYFTKVGASLAAESQRQATWPSKRGYWGLCFGFCVSQNV